MSVLGYAVVRRTGRGEILGTSWGDPDNAGRFLAWSKDEAASGFNQARYMFPTGEYKLVEIREVEA